MQTKDELGRHGEELAAQFLAGAGIEVIDRNWRCAEGEIDLVGLEHGTLVIIEVKTRSSLNYGHPFEAVSPAKLARLHVLASRWSAAHRTGASRRRVDVVSVLDDGAHPPVIEHLREVES